QWLEKRLERLLPVEHFHVVFTLPAALHPLVLHHPRRLYDLLFQAYWRRNCRLPNWSPTIRQGPCADHCCRAPCYRSDRYTFDVCRGGVEGPYIGVAANSWRLAGLPQVIDVLLLDERQERVKDVAVHISPRAPWAGVLLIPYFRNRAISGHEVVGGEGNL